jgi:hypothetical protein
MKKEELKSGMLVELRNGNILTVLKDTEQGDILQGDGIIYKFNCFTDELLSYSSAFDEYFKNEDIVGVYAKPANIYRYNIENLKCIWKRKTPIGITINTDLSIEDVEEIKKIINELQNKLDNLKIKFSIYRKD